MSVQSVPAPHGGAKEAGGQNHDGLLRAFTVATGQSGYFDALLRSCEQHGLRLEVLGQGMEWQGFMWRLRLLDERLARLPADELIVVTDGYDTVVMSDARDLRNAYATICADQRLADERSEAPANATAWRGGLSPLVLAPEHPREWCTCLFSQIFSRCSHWLYGLPYFFFHPASHPYVLNAGVIIGPVASFRAYYKALFAEAEATNSADDQHLLNRLFWSGRMPVPVAVDLRGSAAYCHTMRDATSVLVATFVNQNSLWIAHDKHLILEDGGLVRVKRTGARLGIMHAIANGDVDEVCVHAKLPRPRHRKVMSQTGMRMFLHGLRGVLYAVPSALLWHCLRLESDARLGVPMLALACLTVHELSAHGGFPWAAKADACVKKAS